MHIYFDAGVLGKAIDGAGRKHLLCILYATQDLQKDRNTWRLGQGKYQRSGIK